MRDAGRRVPPLAGRHRTRGVGPAWALAAAVAAAGGGFVTPVQAQTWATTQFERQIRGEEALQVQVRYGAGTFTVRPADPGHLYRARLRFDEEAFTPIHEFRAGRLVVGVEGSGRRNVNLLRGEQEGALDLRLSRTVPLDLTLDFGAVRAEMDLGGIPLRRLAVRTGASDTQLRVSERNPEPMSRASFSVGAAAFNGRGLGHLGAAEIEVEAGVGDVKLELGGLHRSETRVRVKVGLGALEIRVPREAGIRLTRSGFLSPLTAPELERRGDAHFSANWEGAPVRVVIDVESAFGSVSVIRDG